MTPEAANDPHDPLALVETDALIGALYMQVRTVWARVRQLTPMLRASDARAVLAFADVSNAASVLVARVDLVESRIRPHAERWLNVHSLIRALHVAMSEAVRRGRACLAVARLPAAQLAAQLYRLEGLLPLLEREGLRHPVFARGDRCGAEADRPPRGPARTALAAAHPRSTQRWPVAAEHSLSLTLLPEEA